MIQETAPHVRGQSAYVYGSNVNYFIGLHIDIDRNLRLSPFYIWEFISGNKKIKFANRLPFLLEALLVLPRIALGADQRHTRYPRQ